MDLNKCETTLYRASYSIDIRTCAQWISVGCFSDKYTVVLNLGIEYQIQFCVYFTFYLYIEVLLHMGCSSTYYDSNICIQVIPFCFLKKSPSYACLVLHKSTYLKYFPNPFGFKCPQKVKYHIVPILLFNPKNRHITLKY